MRLPSRDIPGGFTSVSSPSESARFEREVRRYAIGDADPGPMLDAIRDEGAALAIVRFPASRPEILARLRETGGEVLLGDALVVWRRDNVRLGPPAPPRGKTFAVRLAGPPDLDLLDRLTDEIFVDYRNHYATNPTLHGFDLAEGYKEWTRTHVGDGELRCLIGSLDGVDCCYATVRIDAEESETVLNGVLPAYRGRGAYRDLLRSMVALFVEEGAKRSMISTQLDNTAAQRAWAREGFFPSDACFTAHVNRS